MFGWVEQAFQNKMLSKTQPWIYEMTVNIKLVALFLALAKFSLGDQNFGISTFLIKETLIKIR